MSIDWSKYGVKQNDDSGINWDKYLPKVNTDKPIETPDQTRQRLNLPTLTQALSSPLGVTKKQLNTNDSASPTPTLPPLSQTLRTPLNTTPEQRANAPVTPELPGRDIPFIGDTLRALDRIEANPIRRKIGELAQDFYTPGTGLSAVNALTQGAESLVSKLAPKAVSSLAGRAGAKAASEAIVGAPLGAAQYLANQGGKGNVRGTDIAAQGLAGAALGGAIGGAIPIAGAAISKFANTPFGTSLANMAKRKQSIPQELETRVSEALKQKTVTMPGVLRPASQESYINKVMSEINPIVTERMTPPLENPDELARWIKPFFGDISMNEMRRLSYDELVELANGVRQNMSMVDIAQQVAKERGYNLMEILDGKLPSIGERAKLDASKRAYGIYDAPELNIRRPVTPQQAEKAAATAAEEAEKMKGNWFTNLFGQQGVGISPFGSNKRINANPLTTKDQIVSSSIKKDAQGVKGAIAAQGRAVYQNLVDRLDPLKRISNQTYESAMDASRSNNIANVIVNDSFVNPEGVVIGPSLKKTFQKVARGQDRDFIDYLTLRHAETRLKRGERVYAENLGMTPEKVRQRLDMYDSRNPGFAKIAAEWDQFNDNVLRTYGVDEGMISENLYNALREKNPNYSPMRRQFSLSEKPGKRFLAKSTGSAFSGQNAPIQKVSPTGSVRNIVDPRKTTVESVGAWVNASMRNRVMQSMVDAIKRDPEAFKGVAQIVKQPKGKTDLRKVLLDNGIDDFAEELNSDFAKLFKTTKVDKDNIVRAMVKGEPVYIQVDDPEIIKALIGMGPQASNILIDTLSMFSNATKRGATGLLAPVFAVKGATMDLVQSAIQAKKPAEQVGLTVYSILSGIGDKLKIPGLRNLAQEYKRAGGEYSAALKGDRKLNTNVSNMTRYPLLSPQSVAKGAKRAVTFPFKALEAVGDIAENAPRMAAYKSEMRRLGGERTPENVRQAMSAAREITTNFSRKGALSRDIESFVPYNNAAVQGTYRVLKGIKDNPVKTIAAIGTLAVLPKMYEYFQFADDPDYQNLPARERYRFLIVNKNKDGTFTKIPMEPAYNSFGELTIEAMRSLRDNDPNAFKGAADALANAWLPPAVTGALQGVTQGTGPVGSLAGSANSTVFAPAAAIMSNKSFTGAPIVPKSIEGRNEQYQYDERTSAVAKKIGEYTKMSPVQVDYLIRAYGGDPARLILPLTSDVGQGNVRNTLLKNFIVDPAFTNTLSNDFFNARTQLNKAHQDNQDLGVPLPSWYDENLRKSITSTAKGSISKQVSELSAQKKEINANKLLSAEAKTKRLREVQQRINQIYIDINSKLQQKGVPTNE